MKLSKLSNGLVATVLAAAITSAAASYIVLRYSPTGGALPAPAERIVRDYLLKNPEILVQMTTELEKRQAFEQQHQAARRQQKTIFENADAIFRSPVAHVAGNPNGDVSVVEFFDYKCGYCRRASLLV